MSFVLDCSVAAAWLLGEDNPAARAHLQRAQAEGAVVPALWLTELSNVMLTGVRRKRFTVGDAHAAIAAVRRLPIEIDRRDPATDMLIDTAARLGLTAYDAHYLLLASRRRLPLATFDRQLAKAAAQAGIGVL
jgi:predicted nucleic acid-binding protein